MSIKEMIDGSHKSRYQIAKEAEMSQGTLGRYYKDESSIYNMTIGTAMKLSQALDYPVAAFIENGLKNIQETEDS